MPADALPDWDAPFAVAGRTAFAAHERPGLAFAPPLRLEAAPEGDTPAVTLDVVAQDRSPGLVTTGFLQLRLETRFDLPETRLALFGQDEAMRVEPLPAAGGLLRLVAPDLAGTDELPDLPLDGAGVAGLTASVSLDGVAADLVVEALHRGIALVEARALVTVRGAAARWPGVADVDVARLRAGLGGDPVRVRDLLEALVRAPAALGVVVSGAAAEDDAGRARLAAALADRVTAELGSGILDDDGEACVLLAAEAPDHMHWELDDVVVAPRHLALATDPWGPLRAMTAEEVGARVVRRHVAPALDSGHRTLGIASVIRPPWAGAVALAADVTVPPRPPERPATVRETVVLDPAAPFTTLALRLAPGEPLAARVRTITYLDSPVPELPGPELDVTSETVVLGPDAFGAAFLPVEIDDALRAQAVAVDVVHEAEVNGLMQRTRVTLDAGTPRATLVVAPDTGSATLHAEARDAVGRVASTPPLESGPTRFDPFSFGGAGRHEVTIDVSPDGPFAGGSADGVLRLELTPEAGGPVGAVALTADRPRAVWSYLALSPFTPGYRWRRAGESDFSEPLGPDTPLRVPAPVPGGTP
ncbi:hypothetical protein Bcav_0354 [Beutenbergia cavernae DSM 12333]|uniref:Uncharacterized protein n=1 Tax=Beutenbergia cavernae (strain ATCC BAA-8 / DSM 12333 / CCUG 43141 / JCM 11478 / NBRC 16432 / NCIMB 13614 / HKI 0122) TaxID=471853 RepID=C5BWG0_BEUC1|nr:hypothetical protein [Beutenbergia cavernae]ACQ78618.1 hypothetical protein Bcav_0354 [Beutenbergia cavernae DSM 12333]